MRGYLNCVSSALILLGMLGCTTVNSSNRSAFRASQAIRESVRHTDSIYVLQAGDVMDIKFYYHPKLNETVIVRPDGRISLQLIGELIAAERTPSELNGIITKKYARYLKNPEIVVIMKEFAGQKVYVGGEVTMPGVIPLTGNTTALQAILTVGGFRETAHPGSVIIISRGPNNAPVAQKVDLRRAISGKARGKDVLLKPFDVVYVPKTFIAEVNKFVEQYITKMIPGTLTAGFNYTILKSTDNSVTIP